MTWDWTVFYVLLGVWALLGIIASSLPPTS